MQYITDGVRKLKRPKSVVVNFAPDRNGRKAKPQLIVTYSTSDVQHVNGLMVGKETVALPISKKVAEVLIARGIFYGG